MSAIAPKTVARLLRFRQVLQLVDTAERVDWSAIAQEAGLCRPVAFFE
jgi:hypothetical protein